MRSEDFALGREWERARGDERLGGSTTSVVPTVTGMPVTPGNQKLVTVVRKYASEWDTN